jgi:hypothetical protein
MKRFIAVTSLAAAAGILGGSLPAGAQYANEFSPARLIQQGTTSLPASGSGKVIVQVQVNADGTHKAIKVISSTNPGDNGAALDIAQHSTYRPAHRGTTPITSFYDFTFKFNGKSAVSAQQQSEGGSSTAGLSPAASAVANLIAQKNYAAAKSKAESELISAPNDDSLRQMYGIAAFNTGDVTAAAAAFYKVPSIGKQFEPIAAASFASAAVALADQNPSLSLTYAQKAAAMSPSTDSRFALGVAQLSNKQYNDAVATLKSVHDSAMNDPKLSKTAKENIDSRLMSAYLATNNTAGAQAIAAEMKQLDPSSNVAGRVLGNSYLKMGVDAATAEHYDEALKNFNLAAAQGDPQVAVTANTQAAFVIAKTSKPDYKQMQAYADKAIALKPNDAEANYAEGIALTAQWAQSHDDAQKKKALDALNHADALAKSAGNEALALTIETFIKNNLTEGAGK